MKNVSLTIDGKYITACEGDKLLWVALDNGIYMPNLCAIREASEPAASCRLCFVEIEGRNSPVTACTEPVTAGMVVDTRGPRAQRLARTAAELLVASHHVDCAHCAKSGSCELQSIAAHLRIKLRSKRFRKYEPALPIDDSCSNFRYDPNKCVLCGRCVWVCHERLGIGTIGFTRRGFQRQVTTFEERPLAESKCEGFDECVRVCPVGALVFKDGKSVEKTAVKKSRG